MENSYISNFEIAAYTATLKNTEELIKTNYPVVAQPTIPKPGDLIVARCIQPRGAYDRIEYGVESKHKLSAGDITVLVLGNRSSSTHIYGVVSEEALEPGDILDLLSGAGMVGKALHIPSRFDHKTTQFELIGFVSKDGKRALNLLDLVSEISEKSYPNVPCIFIGGSSAQVGKTTFVGKLIKAIKSIEDIQVSVIKATGTGSAKYHDIYKQAGADYTLDYVEFGHPSTYGMNEKIFNLVMHQMLAQCGVNSDIVIIELGGDLYEANCPEAIKIASEMGSEFIFVTNDAMGAKEGLRFLEAEGISEPFISSFRQNLYSLAQRLSISMDRVVDMDVAEEMRILAKKFVTNSE